MIEAGLRALITTSSTFTQIAGQRLYPVLFPENCELPAAAYQVIWTRAIYAINGRVNFTQMRIQFSSIAGTYAEVRQLSVAIHEIVDDFSGALSDGSRVFGIQCATEGDRYEPDVRLFCRTADYIIQFAS